MESPKTDENSDGGVFRKLWRYRKLLIIEPLLLCWLLPSCLLIVTMQNLALEKACRVNLGYDSHICISMLDKELYGIDCDALTLEDEASGSPVNGSLELTPLDGNSTLITNENGEMENSSLALPNEMVAILDVNRTVCKAEIETQKQVTYINAIRGPMSSIFPIIVILFAGGWSDRHGVRKPCMLFPMIGEFLSMTGLLITSIFMEVIPMEFGTIVERVVPSVLGGQTLMIMGMYSYMTEITEEKDRAFRFGIFGVCANLIQLFGTPFSGTLHTMLGYVKMLIIGDCILFIGILYLIFFIPEISKKPKIEETNGSVNAAFESDGRTIATLQIDDKQNGANNNITTTTEKSKWKKNFLADFFDPTSAYECIQIFLKKRPNNARFYLILLVLSYSLFIAPAIGEADYYYNFVLIHLKWNGEMFSFFSTYSAALNIIGTFLMTTVLIKILKMSDSMAGFIASLGTVISRPMLAFSKDAILYFAGTAVDLFISCKAIAIKAIISNFVETVELGRLYSILGITEALCGFIFPPIYSQIYSSTLDSFAGAFYLFSEIFLVPTLFLFMATYFYLKEQNKNSHDSAENGVENPACDESKEIESTRV